VVTVAKEQFGAPIKGAKTAPLEVAKMVLSKDPHAIVKEAPPLPVGIDRNTAGRNEIFVEKTRVKSEPVARTGVIERKAGVALDEEIRQKKVFEDRKPVNRQRDLSGGGEEPVRGMSEGGNTNREVRSTGAIERPVRANVRQDESPNQTVVKPQRNDDRIVKPRRDENQSPPIYTPPPTQREEQRERPRREDAPVRNQPPPRDDTPRQAPREEPRREEPKPQEQRREEQKPVPKPPLENENKKAKDG
jgi:hypothetical protein